MELAVFLRVEGRGGGEGWGSFSFSFSLSLLLEPRESHEKAFVSFLVGGGGGGEWACGGGETTVGGTTGLFDGESFEGDQGMAGRTLEMLLIDIFLAGCWSFWGLFGSVSTSVFCPRIRLMALTWI